ncbi:unnamed protein product [Symbiodinium necroappetens]|uniref:Uncharacterized protein n=1 Tax=Symbiodinium necroappetens TaxID=1628268 RepID=A0A812M5X2_9DINO|nr:unnamed protein product [Symbiodinium necroappetens]
MEQQQCLPLLTSEPSYIEQQRVQPHDAFVEFGTAMAVQHSVLAVTLHGACVAAQVFSASLFPQLPDLAPLSEPSIADFFGLEKDNFPQRLERLREVLVRVRPCKDDHASLRTDSQTCTKTCV